MGNAFIKRLDTVYLCIDIQLTPKVFMLFRLESELGNQDCLLDIAFYKPYHIGLYITGTCGKIQIPSQSFYCNAMDKTYPGLKRPYCLYSSASTGTPVLQHCRHESKSQAQP